MTAGQSEDDDFFPISFESTLLWKADDENEDRNWLEILNSLRHVLCHIIFSLMTGRPVIVVGKTESKSRVQAIVETLSLFLPGHSRHHHCISSWFTGSRLTEEKLTSIKLVGTDKDNVDISVHKLEISYLDIDAHDQKGDLVTSPLYLEGVWINQIVNHLTMFSSKQAYLAYVHTIFATMALKAYVYHHMYVGEYVELDNPDAGESISKGYMSESSSEGNGLNRKWSVRRIMNYLKRIEEREYKTDDYTTPASTPVSESLPSSSLHTQILKQFQNNLNESLDEEGSLSDENEATVTLQNVGEQPMSLLDFNWYPSTVLDTETRRRPSESFSEFSTSSSTNYFQYGDICFDNEEEELSSGSSRNSIFEEQQIPERPAGTSQPENLDPDGLSLNERRGRQFLQEKLDVYGDDQTIIVYMATLTSNDNN
ncbi:Guanine nucleotide exchange protein smcr8 [Apophysomyces sp. BC1015]|nr:Guanine nucleotide exchange protein smcr8 [Apophysomyces sp. BC1015]